MPRATDVLDEARQLITKRLAEIEEEKKRLEGAVSELGASRPRQRGRPPGRKAGATTKAGPPKTHKRRGGGRADQAVKEIEKKPGIGAAEIAKRMKIKPNYLYRVLGDLEKEGRVKKKGRAYHPGS
jgi:DNA invertase Pin-like site-specific DNA recombinase